MTKQNVARTIVDCTDARSYSGRGMYGDHCVGITTSNPFRLASEIVASAHEMLTADEFDDFLDIFTSLSVSTDSMGRDEIVYFRELAWLPEYSNESEDE